MAATLATATACVLPERPPMPKGKEIAINSVATAEMLTHRAGYILVGPGRDKPATMETFLYDGKVLQQKPTMRQRVFNHNMNPVPQAAVPGAELIPRIISIQFAYGSTRLRPTGLQRLHIRQLLAVADRIVVKGRTDGVGDREGDEQTAMRRAMAAQRYLLDRGVPSNKIAVNYVSGGDYIADNMTQAGRHNNRRVDIEFIVTEFTKEARK